MARLADFTSVVYAPPTAGGGAHLLFQRDGTRMAQPFDDVTLQAVGDPLTVASQVSLTSNFQQVAAIVANGTLVYLAGSSETSS